MSYIYHKKYVKVREQLDKISKWRLGLSRFHIYEDKELGGYFPIKGKNDLLHCLQDIQSNNLQSPLVKKLLDFPLLSSPDEQLISQGDTPTFKDCIDQLRSNLNDIEKALKQSIPEDTEDSIFIQIPQKADLAEITKIYSYLKFTFLVFSEAPIKGEVKIKGALTGSMWMQLTVGSLVAVKFFIDQLKTASEAYKNVQEGNKFKKQAELYQIKIDHHTEKIANKENEQLRKEVRTLMDAYDTQWKENKESVRRLEESIKNLAKLLNANVEFASAITAPDDIKQSLVSLQSDYGRYTVGKSKEKKSLPK